MSDEDEQAIRELLDRQRTAWDAGDAAGYAAVFTTDADYVTFLGTRHRGRIAIAASYLPMFTGLLKGSRLVTEIIELRFLTPDVIPVITDAAVLRRSRTRGTARINTSVAVRTDSGWLLASSQNTTRRRVAERLMRTLVSRV